MSDSDSQVPYLREMTAAAIDLEFIIVYLFHTHSTLICRHRMRNSLSYRRGQHLETA